MSTGVTEPIKSQPIDLARIRAAHEERGVAMREPDANRRIITRAKRSLKEPVPVEMALKLNGQLVGAT